MTTGHTRKLNDTVLVAHLILLAVGGCLGAIGLAFPNLPLVGIGSFGAVGGAVGLLFHVVLFSVRPGITVRALTRLSLIWAAIAVVAAAIIGWAIDDGSRGANIGGGAALLLVVGSAVSAITTVLAIALRHRPRHA
ncbi:hypothetical protein [Nocardia sp. NPDC052566]|uniref:hypothetical protein n=1 Tax=Nocardia sp. NPDC052566 TaxID=3364330 RepID=UPI0037C995A4